MSTDALCEQIRTQVRKALGAASGPAPAADASVAALMRRFEAGYETVNAEAIVAFRDENGPFRSAEQLAQVKGIGLRTVERNVDRIEVGAAGARAGATRAPSPPAAARGARPVGCGRSGRERRWPAAPRRAAGALRRADRHADRPAPGAGASRHRPSGPDGSGNLLCRKLSLRQETQWLCLCLGGGGHADLHRHAGPLATGAVGLAAGAGLASGRARGTWPARAGRRCVRRAPRGHARGRGGAAA